MVRHAVSGQRISSLQDVVAIAPGRDEIGCSCADCLCRGIAGVPTASKWTADYAERPPVFIRLGDRPKPAVRPSDAWLAECALSVRPSRRDPHGLLNIAAGSCSNAHAVVRKWRAVPGLWEGLCRLGLWQGATFAGKPVHDERTATAYILNALGEQWRVFEAWREAALWACGLELAWRMMQGLGRINLDRSSWRMWRARLDASVASEDDDPALFQDGWPLRVYSYPARDDDDESQWLAELGQDIAEEHNA